MKYLRELDQWIAAYLLGQLDEADKIRLDSWRQASSEHEKLFQRLCSKSHWQQGIKEIASFDTEKDWKKVVEKTRRYKTIQWRKWSGVAAVVLILLGAGITAWFRMPETTHITATTGTKNTIRLNTASGESFLLDSVKCIETGKTVMKNSGKRLLVQTSDIQEKDIEWNTIEIPRGADYMLILDDGTEIFLNAETVLRFPNQFKNKGNREVWLKGEAYFKVQRDSLRPFIVHSEETSVRVLGTVFNIMAYPNVPELQVTLLSGKVEVEENAKGTKVTLKPGEQAVYNKQQKKLGERTVDVSYYTAWHEKMFAFRDCPLVQVMEILARWYDVEVFFQNTQARDYIYTGKIKRYASLKEVLDNFRETREFDFEIHGKTVIIK